MVRPRDEVHDRVGHMLGMDPVGWTPARSGGYTPAERWIAHLPEGGSVFVKVGVSESTAAWLRDEHRVYRQMQAPFLPRFLGWDEGEAPILLLEDLSAGTWPPPWDESRIDRAITMLDEIRGTPPPEGLPTLASLSSRLAGWRLVAGEPESFLALGVCSPAWLERALPDLIRADESAVLAGEELLHLDVRSDNICFMGDRTLIVDWNSSCVGNAILDRVAWVPSLFLEWGPQAESIAPDEPELAGLMAGYFAHHARLPHIADAPRVRGAQRDALKVCLPWAARLLGLPPPDGNLDVG